MLKKLTALLLISAFAVLLYGCSSSNEYGLTYTSDGSEKVEYIYYNDQRVVYVIGGLMMAEVDGDAKMLEMALAEGDILIDDLISSAIEDIEEERVDGKTYPDGSREIYYNEFNMVILNTHLGNVDVYFAPSGMGYFDVIKK